MYLVDLVTAIWALVCLWIHTVLGHHRVHLPVQHSDAARFSRATMWVCWHVTTWVLALVCATLIAASMGHPLRLWFLGWVFALALPFSILFMVTGVRVYGSWRVMPQLYLLGPIAVGTAVATQANWVTDHGPALIFSMTLVSLALLHGSWALGSAWPAKNRAALSDLVVGQPAGSRFPSTAATFFVAFALLAMASVPWIQKELWGWAPTMMVGIGILFAVRGVLGFSKPGSDPQPDGSPMANTTAYCIHPCAWY